MGLAAALALPGSAGALLFLLPPIAFLAMLHSDRRKHIDETVALSALYSDTNELARRDALTDLANRLTWEEATAQFEQSDSSFGVLFADVDGLKRANDKFGHEMGDRLLIAVADVLERSGDPAGRRRRPHRRRRICAAHSRCLVHFHRHARVVDTRALASRAHP